MPTSSSKCVVILPQYRPESLMPLNLERVCIEGKRCETLDGFLSDFGNCEGDEEVGHPLEVSKYRSLDLVQLPKPCVVLLTIEVMEDISPDCSKSYRTAGAEEASTRDAAGNPIAWKHLARRRTEGIDSRHDDQERPRNRR